MKNGNYILVKAPENFPGKKYRNKYCLEHHLVYWNAHNIVPKSNEVIHHINENRFDNRIENLELITRKNHSNYHSSKKGRFYVDIQCPNCRKIFTIPFNKCFIQKHSSYTCCCRQCSGVFASKIKLIKNFDPNNTIIRKYKKNLEP